MFRQAYHHDIVAASQRNPNVKAPTPAAQDIDVASSVATTIL